MPSVVYLNTVEAAEDAITNDLRLPDVTLLGRIQTMNNYGVMRHGQAGHDVSTKEFLAIASNPEAKVLEIGVAYGNVCMEAIKSGCTNYTAVDLDERHVKILGKSFL